MIRQGAVELESRVGAGGGGRVRKKCIVYYEEGENAGLVFPGRSVMRVMRVLESSAGCDIIVTACMMSQELCACACWTCLDGACLEGSKRSKGLGLRV